ncbi:hypothetical protein P8452_30598 [Trifolium repens]|nr:hypothetical protein P8452_30598 [Trifolium repens]
MKCIISSILDCLFKKYTLFDSKFLLFDNNPSSSIKEFRPSIVHIHLLRPFQIQKFLVIFRSRVCDVTFA